MSVKCLITKEFAGTDAAPDELKSMRITKKTTLKNLRVRIRDGAHAAGRCDLMLDDVAVLVDPSSRECCYMFMFSIWVANNCVLPPGWHRNGTTCLSWRMFGAVSFGVPIRWSHWYTTHRKIRESFENMILGFKLVMRCHFTSKSCNCLLCNPLLLQDHLILRWRRRAGAIGRQGTCALPSTGIPVYWSQPHDSSCTCQQLSMQPWRTLQQINVCQWHIILLILLFYSHYFWSQWQCPWLRIYERRSMPSAKKKASKFLESINPEAIIQLAMMCDAAEEEMVLSLGLKKVESDL